MRTRFLVVVFVLGTALLLGACAERGRAGGPPPPDSSVTSSPVPSGPIREPTPVLVTPRPGLVEARPHAWESVDVEDDRTLLIQFYGGVEECYGLDHVDVRYGADEVTVTLYEGQVPGERVCIDLAMLKSVRVHLDQPLNGRKVVDGSAQKS
jgi:hypothetical protein